VSLLLRSFDCSQQPSAAQRHAGRLAYDEQREAPATPVASQASTRTATVSRHQKTKERQTTARKEPQRVASKLPRLGSGGIGRDEETRRRGAVAGE
jgi:hypothetical protein